MMDERQLEAFLAILENRSISRAAETLRISQPAVSQLLLRLEDEVGTRLFERTPRGVVPTDAAINFRQSCYNILNEFRLVREQIADPAVRSRDRVRIGLPHPLAGLFNAHFLEHLAESLSLDTIVFVDGTSGQIKEAVQDETVDFGILYNVDGLEEAFLTPVASEELVLVSKASGMPSPGGALEVAIDLRIDCPKLVLPGFRNPMRRYIESVCAGTDLDLTPTYLEDSLTIIKSVARLGLASTILPHSTMIDEAAAGFFAVRRIAYPDLARRVFTVRKSQVMQSAQSALVEKHVVAGMRYMAESGIWMAQPMPA
jgi:LysR family nitrogen assimilation transcriptional regulator